MFVGTRSLLHGKHLGMNFSVESNVLKLGKREIKFPFKISHIETFGEVILVITDYYKSNINENVWGVNRQGEIIWQVPKVDEVEFEGKRYTGITNPYTGVHKVDKQ